MDGGYIIDPSARGLPEQDWQMIIKHAERFRRAADALEPWARRAKECVEFFEGKQWKQSDLQKLEQEGRPALTINKIMPLVNLVMGYHLNNQTDINYLAGNDGSGTADIARVLSAVSKQISVTNQLPYVDAEVFLDGILGGRGYWDCKVNFENNTRGEVEWKAEDPFTVYPDPDAQDYDLNTGNYVIKSRWLSVDDIQHNYGVEAANLIRPLTNGLTFNQFPSTLYEGHEEISPWRRFGGDEDNPNYWRMQTDQFYNWVDTLRKTIRALDIQHYVRTWRWHFIDLDTGDQSPVPDTMSQDRVQRVLMWARDQGEHLIVQRKQVRRLRWTHMVGDVMVYDAWADYQTFTTVPFFPYFRRGQTRGMVEPLLDPQREINVRRSARQNIIGRSSNGGWKYEKGSLTPQEKENLSQNAGRPGFNLEYDRKGGTLNPPEIIPPAQSPVSVEQLEQEAGNDLKEIAGINESALGQIDQATVSGRAILARQQQTVIGLEGFINNYHRSKQLCGKKQLECIQTFYTEQRVIRIVGPGSSPIAHVINQRAASGVVNDVTAGKYDVVIDEESLTDSFLEGQFNELMQMKQMGIPIPDDFIVDASSIGRKDELRASIAAARQQQAAMGAPPGAPPAGGPGPGGSRVGPDGGSMKAGPEPGAPPPLHGGGGGGAPMPAGGPMGAHGR